MKKNIIIVAIIILILAALGAGYCYYLHVSSAAVTVMYDITDPAEFKMDTAEVPRHIAQYTSEWGATSIRFLTISDFQETQASTINIPVVFPLTANPYKRQSDLQAASQSILKQVNDMVAQDTGRSQSVIYAPIANQLNLLAKSGAHIKELIVYSDLMENDQAFSSYRTSDTLLLHSHPEQVKALFEKEVPLDSLTGITVYLIYNARTPCEQNRFLTMAHLWRSIFEKHEATVVIGPNIPN
jgi:hypothetical protein